MGLPKLPITELIEGYNKGDQGALERLIPHVYDHLKRIASRQMRSKQSGNTLQPTALVHEVFLHFLNAKQIPFEGRAHFFAAAAKLMRWILLDRAKANRRKKRGGGAIRVTFNEAVHPVTPEESADVIALDDALNQLSKIDPRRARVVELRFYGGLAIEDIATILGASSATIKRDWVFSRAWLRREMRKKDAA